MESIIGYRGGREGVMKPFYHDAQSVMEACFGKEGFKIEKADLFDLVRILFVAGVLDFLDRLDGMDSKDRLIVETLFAVVGIKTVSELVELVERVFFGLVVRDEELAREYFETFQNWILRKNERGVVQ